MGRIKKNYKLKPLYALDGNWTKICNSMFKYIPNGNDFKVYCYLCYRYNNEYQYAFPSLETIAKDTCISKNTVQKSIKWLESQKFIVRYKHKESEWMNNCYYVRYVEITKETEMEAQKEIIKNLENIIEDEFKYEVYFEVEEEE